MNEADLPSVSVLIPTLNAETVLGECLESILNQNYPREKIEVIITDGGSTDKTLAIAKRYGAKTYANPLKTGEAGKALAFKKAKGDLIALIDSDNILPDKGWLKRMIAPFSDPAIIGSEPWEYTYLQENGFITRYCALLGMNDPLCYFLGNYDRLSVLTGKWTGLKVEEEEKNGWLKITLKHDNLPTIGANGTILRREILAKKGLVSSYLVDIDILAQLSSENPIKFAKVKTGIIHLYCGSNIGTFIRKQRRRIKDFLFYQKSGERSYPWQKQNKIGILKFILSCVTIFPLFYQTLKGYSKKPDFAWFFHPIACWLTLGIYGFGVIEGLFISEPESRKDWRQ